MALSQHDRKSLLARVERKLADRINGGEVSRDTLRATIERVCSTVNSSGTPVEELNALVVLSAISTPDLASRVRRRLAVAGDGDAALSDVGVATVGRFTVVAA